MASNQAPSSSIWAKPILLLKLGLARIRAIGSFVLWLLPNKLRHGWPLRRTLFACVAYSQDQYINFHEARYLMPPTGDSIRSYCAEHGISDTVQGLQCEAGAPEASLHYLNCQPEDPGNVLLYFHGGGYGNPIIAPGHVPFALEVGRAASVPKVAILEYTLAPAQKYPGQLIQAISALRHLLKSHRPSEILIGGDSAGGNLTLAVLAHIINASSYTQPLELLEKLRGALMISPWVDFGTTAPSYTSNGRRDFLAKVIVNDFVEALAPKRGELYAEPVVASPAFWKELPVQKSLITSGTWEIFDDDIRKLAENMDATTFGTVGAPVELALAEKECHIQCIADMVVGVEPPRIMMSQVLDWSRRL